MGPLWGSIAETWKDLLQSGRPSRVRRETYKNFKRLVSAQISSYRPESKANMYSFFMLFLPVMVLDMENEQKHNKLQKN